MPHSVEQVLARESADVDWPKELIDQLEWHWSFHVRKRLDGLTEEEYRWEPAPGAWSIRPRAQGRGADPRGAGEMVLDWEYPEPTPVPVTTIAWRLGHLATVFGIRASNHFGDGRLSYDTVLWPDSAAGMLAFLDEQHDAWVNGVRELGADGLARTCGPSEGPFSRASMAALVLHINREVIHHSAEVLVLRDLWRNGAG